MPPSAITGTRIAVDDTILLTNNTPNEMTFEEFRANAFEKYRMLAFMTAGELEAREMAEEVAAVATQQQQNPPSSYNGNISGDIVDSDDEEVVSRPVQQSDKKKRIAVSPTINTKAALADVYEMFSQPLSCEQYDEEDETVKSAKNMGRC